MFDHKKIEEKWKKKWSESELYKTSENQDKPKQYILDMFPYPSGEGLHVGHPKGYIATDIVSRMRMMQGFNVLHPMGWDAFGLPAENYALKTKTHPKTAVKKNIEHFKQQLEKIGFTYDWSREINTTDPKYYRWTQWCFLQMFKKGLAYESYEPINWCPSCKTGLANEDLEGGRCERCDSEIERKPMRQWVIKITEYAEQLLQDIKQLTEWEDSIKDMQRAWIGRSEGTLVKFPISNFKFSIEVFTTRLDTIYGCTYVVLAPEHELISTLLPEIKNQKEVQKYIEHTKKKTDLLRTGIQKEKTGIRLEGVSALNPFTQEEIPVFIADYVLGSYGTGAVMAVPAHDERDFSFAKKYNLPIRKTITPPALAVFPRNANDIAAGAAHELRVESECYTLEGDLVNSDHYSGVSSQKAREKMTEWLTQQGIGEKKVTYRLRDWVFSRQRYWGEPIPIIHCETCGPVGVPEDQLPVLLPEIEHYEPTGTGESPLAAITEWVTIPCPSCKGPGKRETNTMPQWAGSSWYYLRYCDPDNIKTLIDQKKETYWLPVDLYVGGAEHATRHLIYARFWHKFLKSIGVVSTDEPFKRLYHVGLIMGEDNRKMSKRWGNVINPDEIIGRFGADTLRMYEMFMGPFSNSTSWSTDGLVGVRRFLERVDNWFSELKNIKSQPNPSLHKTIQKVTDDIENFHFNTAVSTLMIFVNETRTKELSKEDASSFIKLLAPFCPFLAEELYERLGNQGSIFTSTWPVADKNLLQDAHITLVIQINSKVRETLTVDVNISKEDALALAKNCEIGKKWLDGKNIKNVIFVPKKLLNIITD